MTGLGLADPRHKTRTELIFYDSLIADTYQPVYRLNSLEKWCSQSTPIHRLLHGSKRRTRERAIANDASTRSSIYVNVSCKSNLNRSTAIVSTRKFREANSAVAASSTLRSSRHWGPSSLSTAEIQNDGAHLRPTRPQHPSPISRCSRNIRGPAASCCMA